MSDALTSESMSPELLKIAERSVGSDLSAGLGSTAANHKHGRAGWWKSPCPDLARAPRE